MTEGDGTTTTTPTTPPRRWKKRNDPSTFTVLKDPIHWETLRLPYRGCAKVDPTQLWRCRKHKRIEAECLLSLPPRSSFLDCGSHFGDTVLTMAVHARANGRTDLRFFAFEPSRRKCKFIWDMVRANGLEDSVKVLNCCVGDGSRSVCRIPEKGFERYDGRVAYRPRDDECDDGGGAVPDSVDTPKTTDSLFSCRCYFDGSAHASGDYSSSDSDDSSSSDDEDYEEGLEKTKTSSVPMVSLDSLKFDIQPLGFLHLDVEGWEARTLCGARDILSEARGTTCYVVSEVWGERDCRRRREACIELVDATPDEDVEAAMKDHPHFERLDDIVDGERNLFYQCNPA